MGASRDSWPLSDSGPFSWGDVWAQAARLGASGSERFCSLMSAPRDTNRVGHAPGPPGAVPEHHGLGVCFRGAGAESCLPARGHRVVPQGRMAQVPRSGLPFSTGARALAAPDRLPAGRRGPPSGRPAAPVRGGRGPSAECARCSSSWVSGSSGPRGAGVLKRLLLGAETAVLGARSREFLRAKAPAPAVSGDPAPPARGRWGGRAILGARSWWPRGWWPRLPGPRAPASPRGGGEVTTLGPPPRPPRPHEALPGTREDLGGRRLVGQSRHVDGPWRGPWKGVRRQAPHLRHRQPGAP